MLLKAFGAGAIPGFGIFALEEVKNIRVFETGGFVGEAFFVDEEGKIDGGVFAKHAGVVAVAEADGGEGRAFLLELGLVFAQLRDVLPAEDSTVVAEEHDHGGMLFPQRAEAHGVAVGIGEGDARKHVAEGIGHPATRYHTAYHTCVHAPETRRSVLRLLSMEAVITRLDADADAKDCRIEGCGSRRRFRWLR